MSRRNRAVVEYFFFFVVLAAILFGSRTAVAYWVDLLWFRSLGYGDVFWKTRWLQWGVFAGFAVATFVVLFGVFSILKRTHGPDLPSTHTIFVGGQPLHLPIAKFSSIVAVLVAGIISLATGTTMAAQWSDSCALLVCTTRRK